MGCLFESFINCEKITSQDLEFIELSWQLSLSKTIDAENKRFNKWLINTNKYRSNLPDDHINKVTCECGSHDKCIHSY